MPEMRAETEREAKRKETSRPAGGHVSTHEGEPEAEADPSGARTQPDPATHEEHLRSSGKLKGGATGGPS